MQISLTLSIIITVVVAAAAAVLAFLAGVAHRKKTAEFTIGSAEQEAKRIVSEA
ncbi:MAG TPA: ribonuclease Y, partial [Ruminococcaceae bacterium]|nr:ribonuclease Y [Oscillospiraceae bacterium]